MTNVINTTIKNVLTVATIWGSDSFKIVDKIPEGYQVWNIGADNMPEGFVPLAKIKDGSKYEIERDTLTTIKTDANTWRTIMAAARFGCNNLKNTTKLLNSKRAGKLADAKRYHAAKTIEIYKELSK